MKLATIYFTERGKDISRLLTKKLDYVIDEFGKDTVEGRIRDKIELLVKRYDGIIFIASTGIAVRFIAPYIRSKLEDPAIVVIDDMGRFTISLLSGHIGGANQLSREISNILRNTPVITTASDGRGIDSVDVFAMRNGFEIDDMEDAKKISSLMVEGKSIRLVSNLDNDLKYPNLVGEDAKRYDGTLAIAPFRGEIDKSHTCCIIRPSILNIGIGCRRGKSKRDILEFIEGIFKENNLSVENISKIGTIDVKSDEVGIIEVANHLGSELNIFSKKEIEGVQAMFKGSQFVKSKVGVTSVCEPSAYLLGEKIIVGKQSLDGITIAISMGKRQKEEE